MRTEEGVVAPVISATIPVPATMKTMAVALLDALGDPFAGKGTLDSQTRRLIDLIGRCSVELIILDEFQHFIDRDSDKVLQAVSDWLKNLISRTRVPVVLTGLPHCRKVLDANEQLHRRFSTQEELLPFQWGAGREKDFCKFLEAIDKKLPFLERTGLHERDIAWRMFCASGGLPAYVMKVVRGAARHAVDANAPRISQEMLAQAYAERIIAALLIKPMVVLQYGAMILGSLLFYALLAKGCLWLAGVIRPTPEEWGGGTEARAEILPERVALPRQEQPITLDLVDGEWK